MAGVLASSAETVSPRAIPRRASAEASRRARVELRVAAAPGAVDDGGAIGEHGRRPLQERQRGQRLEVRGIAGKIDVVRSLVSTHGSLARRAVEA